MGAEDMNTVEEEEGERKCWRKRKRRWTMYCKGPHYRTHFLLRSHPSLQAALSSSHAVATDREANNIQGTDKDVGQKE